MAEGSACSMETKQTVNELESYVRGIIEILKTTDKAIANGLEKEILEQISNWKTVDAAEGGGFQGNHHALPTEPLNVFLPKKRELRPLDGFMLKVLDLLCPDKDKKGGKGKRVPLESRSVKELKELAKVRGRNVTGLTKAEIIAKLRG